MIRLVLLGCGAVARRHAKTLRKVAGRGVRVSFASRDPARADEFCRELGGERAYPSYQAALADAAVDVVAVLTPPSSHLELTLAALAAGKHVLLEKPPLGRAADFDTVATAAAAARRTVYVAENYYYKPLRRALSRALVEDRVIGEPLLLQINAVKQQRTGDWRDDPALTLGGSLYEGGIHWIDLLANLGLTVARVRGSLPGRAQPGAPALERTSLVTLEYAEGPVATLAYSWEVPSTFKGLRISRAFGRKGSLLFETNGLFLFTHGTETGLGFPGLRDISGYAAMFADFVKSWQTGEPPEFTLAHARRDLEIVEAAYASAAASPGREGTST